MKFFAIAAFAAGFGLTTGAASAADAVKFQLDWLPGGDKAALYVGIHEGFFAAEGLDVTTVPGAGSSDAITKIATGVSDVGTAGIAALMQAAADTPVPVKAVSSIYSKQPDAIFTVEGSGISSLKSVEGHSIATATFSSSNSVWPVLLSENKVDASEVKLIKVDPGALAPMLASGKIDATINWLTVAPLMSSVLKQVGKKLVVIPWSNYGLDGYGWSLMASDRMIKSRPDVLRRFLIAYQKATIAAIADPNLAGAALHAIVPAADPEIAAAQFAASIPLIKNEVSEKDGMGNFDPTLLKATWVWVAKSFNYPIQKIDPETLVDRSFVPKS